MKTVSATELRRRPTEVLARVEVGESLVVTRRGKPSAVLLGYDRIQTDAKATEAAEPRG